jgi:hypothetical protein
MRVRSLKCSTIDHIGGVHLVLSRRVIHPLFFNWLYFPVLPAAVIPTLVLFSLYLTESIQVPRESFAESAAGPGIHV